MKNFDWKQLTQPFDERRLYVVPGNHKETILFCAKQFIQIAQEAIEDHQYFNVALSGGSTPQAIFHELAHPQYIKLIDWSKVICFWSDERSVGVESSENNYASLMSSGLASLPIPKENIFRMVAEDQIEENALEYERLIKQKIPSGSFDLMMLGMGDDGHTASLFPRTHALHVNNHLVVANHVPQKNTWRMSLTFECINQAKIICIYVMGQNKSERVAKALTGSFNPDNMPIQKVGTDTNKAFWILDEDAASKLLEIT